MSVYKSKRGESSVQFIETARQLEAHTFACCMKAPKRYERFLTGRIMELSSEVHDRVRAANNIWPTNRHEAQLRRDELMVAVDMGALPESLFESELFGHCKGAFTDAHTDRIGKFEIAQGGTLFLDEIGNLSYHLQAKLLSAIQSRTIVRVGSNRPVETDVRLICATNQNLQAMVAQERFRRDLLYRINTIHIEIPPLRQRREDIVPLARLFLEKYAAKYGKQGIRIDEEACRKLQEYDWYGNIRELQHTVEKAVIICDSMTIGQESLLMTPQQEEPNAGGVSTLEEMERNMIRQAIRLHESNMSAVAAQLGITRQTLYNKIKKYGL